MGKGHPFEYETYVEDGKEKKRLKFEGGLPVRVSDEAAHEWYRTKFRRDGPSI